MTQNNLMTQFSLWQLEKLHDIFSWDTERAHWTVQSVQGNQLYPQYLHQSGNIQQTAKNNQNLIPNIITQQWTKQTKNTNNCIKRPAFYTSQLSEDIMMKLVKVTQVKTVRGLSVLR